VRCSILLLVGRSNKVDQQQQSRWRPTRRQLLWASGIGAALTVAVLVGYRYDITLWDWLKLLIVPAVIAGGGLWFNRQQRERELEIAREQRERDVEIAERRTKDEALQAYLEQMSDMLIPKTDQPSLYKARPGDSLSSVARARTLTVLPRLDKDRKARVVQFLYESGLIAKTRPIVVLIWADLRKAYLRVAILIAADLSGTDLSRAILREAYLLEADLSGAKLSSADLSGADLSGADLSGAKGTTIEELEQQAKSLEGATMPDGQKYEDWLKSKGRAEDG
jgi:hypothetical protein